MIIEEARRERFRFVNQWMAPSNPFHYWEKGTPELVGYMGECIGIVVQFGFANHKYIVWYTANINCSLQMLLA